mgnify:CR=1 FL=1
MAKVEAGSKPMTTSARSGYPAIYSFIRLREEAYGLLAFNPYLGIQECFPPDEASIVSALDGELSLTDLADAASSGAGGRLAETLSKLERLCAIAYREAPKRSPPRIFFRDASDTGLPSRAPSSAIWELTRTCNMRCAHCLNNSGSGEGPELDREGAVQLLDRLDAAGILALSISGGEPFLRPDLPDLVGRAAAPRKRWS